jgi:hypothetical protein
VGGQFDVEETSSQAAIAACNDLIAMPPVVLVSNIFGLHHTGSSSVPCIFADYGVPLPLLLLPLLLLLCQVTDWACRT